MLDLPKHILLFGHRKQHGKDTCCDILEEYLTDNNISFIRTLFAKSLKEMAAKNYNIDLSRVESEEYKQSKPEHLNGQTVRDILIKIGLEERAKDPLVFCRATYVEMFESGCDFAFASDFRFPNEGSSCDKILDAYLKEKGITDQTEKPTVHKILVHRPDGRFVNDGADDQLPDLDENYWDYVIINDDTSDSWRETLSTRLLTYVESLIIGEKNGFQVYNT